MSAQRVVITGASGLIGRALTDSLRADGVIVTHLVRRTPNAPGEVPWWPGQQPLDPEVLADADAVVNLNGASIGKLPWGRRYRDLLRRSRLDPTRTLAAAIRELGDRAPHFVSASGIGFYGDRPGVTLTEVNGSGETFLAQLCVAWEREAVAAGGAARVALLRTAPVLHRDGVLKPLMLLTKLGLSGPLGRGTQRWPWISLDDEVRAIRHIIDHDLEGPVNLTAPEIVTATDTGRELARQLRRPFLVPAPARALRAALGADAADSLLLSDAAAIPAVLTHSGFTFGEPTLAEAISSALK
ncbi:TIGR01777 family oxidoreductase [Gordonia sp. (in: high G+C Gram-positive bacteria)]|uniref:TIGR01777 family oxidoreductase n=1 Tax=Gordonia sp. (in: high G+C Gram-positive bacteria) TaxID=84139 RepID=UPI00169008FB|nr:TIGR01777 family oxidoreductase [Gordonia sp. (in: high G+C Gram-positive bacteria)]NLG48432.1 TIGR01777 family protein [Gordonia sp. (in: high G+C Gram-positive bacteria)]